MPIDSPHRDYLLRLPQWTRCRDAKGGADAVKRKGTTYLPMLDQQNAMEYMAYVSRAMFYGATERTVEGLTGLILRRTPTLTLPPLIEEDLEDLTLSAQSWESLLLEVLDEALTVGRLGILVEFPKEGQGDRPYWTLFRAETILAWTMGKVVGPDGVARSGLTQLVLTEPIPTPEAMRPDAYQIRELMLDEAGRYTVRIWRKPDIAPGLPAGQGGEWLLVDEMVPLRKSAPLTAIPFVFIGSRHARPQPDKPPLLDMVDVNFSHYRSSADLEHGRHWTALPTPWVTGYAGAPELRIGSAVAWTFANPDAKCGMLEFGGQGLNALVVALDSKEKLMAILGARLLEGEPRRGETAEAVRLRHAGDSATLTSIVSTLDEGLTRAFRWHAWWAGDNTAFDETTDINISLNRDFFEARLDYNQAQTLLTMWQSGGISWETYFWNLQQGEWIPPDRTADQEHALIQADAGTLGLVPPASNGQPGPVTITLPAQAGVSDAAFGGGEPP